VSSFPLPRSAQLVVNATAIAAAIQVIVLIGTALPRSV
jgi:hypothetical protein